MALLQQSRSAAKAIFKAFKGAQVTATYTKRGEPAFTPSTGAVADADTTNSIKIIIIDFHDSEVDGETVKPGDARGFVEYVDLNADEPLALDDHIVTSSDDWEIKGIKRIPASGIESVYEFHLRRAAA